MDCFRDIGYLMRPKDDIEHALDTHGNTVWRVCVLYFGQSADAQDAFQESFYKYSLSTVSYNDDEHRKAWLIRVATNVCKDMLKAAHRKTVSIDEQSLESISAISTTEEDNGSTSTLSEILNAIQSLTDPPRTPVYLALYEGYTAPEIAAMLGAPVNTVYSWIARGKAQLREVLR